MHRRDSSDEGGDNRTQRRGSTGSLNLNWFDPDTTRKTSSPSRIIRSSRHALASVRDSTSNDQTNNKEECDRILTPQCGVPDLINGCPGNSDHELGRERVGDFSRIAGCASSPIMAHEPRKPADIANAPVFGIDVDGNVNEWNFKTAKITGYSREEAFLKPLVSTFIAPRLRQSVQKMLDKALRGHETSNFGLEFQTKLNETQYLLVNACTRRDASNHIVGGETGHFVCHNNCWLNVVIDPVTESIDMKINFPGRFFHHDIIITELS